MPAPLALITDLHYGIRADSQAFLDYYERFNRDFFDAIDKKGVKQVFILGDLFDRRKYVNFVTLNRCRKDFLEPLYARGLDVHVIAGNHDVYYKNTNKVNSLFELLGAYKDFNIYIRPQTVNLIDYKEQVLLLPWITDDNIKETLQEIKKTPAEICFGHLEIKGFEMYRGMKSFEGTEKNVFSKFDVVATGHFHTRSIRDNIHYIGAAYEQNWSDYGDPRGFSFFDPEKKEFDFVQNTHQMYHMLTYDDSDANVETVTTQIRSGDFSKLGNAQVKIVVMEKNNPFLFEQFLDRIYREGPGDVTLVESALNFMVDEDGEDIVDQAEDTMTILNKYVDGLQTTRNRDMLKRKLRQVYAEALELEKSYD